MAKSKLKREHPSANVAIYGLLLALAMVFSYVETLIPISLGVPGVKLGLANLVTMVGLYTIGVPGTVAVNLLRIVLTGFTFLQPCRCRIKPGADASRQKKRLVWFSGREYYRRCGSQYRSAFHSCVYRADTGRIFLSAGASGCGNGCGGFDWAFRGDDCPENPQTGKHLNEKQKDKDFNGKY